MRALVARSVAKDMDAAKKQKEPRASMRHVGTTRSAGAGVGAGGVTAGAAAVPEGGTVGSSPTK